jgi:hypothetical protein
MVKGGPVVVRNIPEDQAPTRGHGIDLGRDDREAVSLRLILRSHGANWIRVGIDVPGLDIGIKRLGVSYRLRPFEPSAVEHRIVCHAMPYA